MPGRREQKEARGYTLRGRESATGHSEDHPTGWIAQNRRRNVSGTDLDRIRNARQVKSRGWVSEERKARVAVP